MMCMDCTSWCGRCLAGKRFRLASDEACDLFQEKEKARAFQGIAEIQEKIKT
jgi:hypothetical protein